MDEGLLLAINGLRAPWIDVVARPLSAHGYLVFPALMLLGLIRPGGRSAAARSIRDGWLTWFTATFACERILKPLIARPRPTAGEALREALDVLGKVPPPESLSMPSGTATACFAGATWILLRWGRAPGALALVFAALVSVSRVYGGVHWPTDIVVGAFFGAAFAVGADRLARWVAAAGAAEGESA